MDRRTFLHPAGPLPASVYWLRRTTVALIALAVVVVVALLVIPRGKVHPDASVTGGPPSSTPPVAASSSAPAASTTPTGATTGPSAGATSQPTGALPACDTSTLTATVTTSARAYAAGVDPRFTVVLKTSGAPCAAAGALTLEVSSGDDREWGSADCTPTSGTSTALGVGGQSAVRSWDRERTVPGCGSVPAGERSADAGTYKVTATWGGVTSAVVAFTLS